MSEQLEKLNKVVNHHTKILNNIVGVVEDVVKKELNSLKIVSNYGTMAYVAKTSTYPITTTDYTIDCTSGTFTVTLPTAIGSDGKIYNIKNSGTGVITVATTSSQTIDGALTRTLAQYDNLQIQSTGANWIII